MFTNFLHNFFVHIREVLIFTSKKTGEILKKIDISTLELKLSLIVNKYKELKFSTIFLQFDA